jgi:hypothetical protein
MLRMPSNGLVETFFHIGTVASEGSGESGNKAAIGRRRPQVKCQRGSVSRFRQIATRRNPI